MIFVSVGTPEKQFNRLIEGVDQLAAVVKERILVQIGHSTYIPRRCDYFKFCSSEEMLLHISNASIVISQAGFGIIGNAIRLNKPLILVPREFKYGEAIDKQYELAEYLANQNASIVCVRDTDILADAVRKLMKIEVHYSYRTEIPDLIDKYILETFF